MSNNFFTYIQHLEMLAFFSGYPLLYFLLRFVVRNISFINNRIVTPVSILPLAYALVGTLYLGLQLSNLYPDYSLENIQHRIQQPGLLVWALLSLLFWIPALAKQQIWTVLHSLVFFFLILKDLFFYLTRQIRDPDIIKNDMRVYTVSIFLNLAAYIFLFLFSFLIRFRKKYPGS